MPRNWKSNFLSSGLPLEFEAAKLLVSKGFSVGSDFTYNREDAQASGVQKDFSVDIIATAYPPFDPKGNALHARLILLIECKYRRPETKWLFFPDINEGGFSSITPGYTLHIVSEFSPYMINESSYKFESRLPLCYKGAEVHIGSKDQEVHDKELKHAVSQLRYALPQLFKDEVWFELNNHPDDNIPFVFCPIILTTADLIVANETLTIETVEKSENISEISNDVPHLILYSDYGPDFERHCSKEFKSLAELGDLDSVKILEKNRHQSASKTYDFMYPSEIGKSLANAERFHLFRYFNQFFVCTYHGFPSFIDAIKNTVLESIETRIKL